MTRNTRQFLFGFILIALFILITSFFYYFTYTWTSPINEKGTHLVFEVKKGDSFLGVVNKLKKQGILKETKVFYLMGKLTGDSHKIKAGEFLINTRWSEKKLMRYLVSGRPYLHKIYIPAGSPWWEVGRILASQGILKFSDFKKVIFDRKFLDQNNIPGKNGEGYLYPDTYYFEKGDSLEHAREVVETLIDEFWKNVRKYVWVNGLPDQTEVYKVVILASIVEKEALYDFEKPIIAGVFFNRLKLNMPLQSDPTVIYGLGPGFSGNLRKKDLRDKRNPYNTYTHKGLPPTPICSPTISSIYAVVHPAKHSYLYFVAKGDGTHKFSRTLREHNLAVYKYQIQGRKKRDARR